MKKISLIAVIIAFFAMSCTKESHFISNKSQRAEVQCDFQAKMAAMPDGDLFSVFDRSLSTKEREALEFLYAYMPLGDVTDYDGECFLRNIEASFIAKEELHWGKSVPEREFNHFVVPIRVNNENLDGARFVFYNELKDRVKDLSMYDAVLEVNHWCHEKVNYKGSDSRTSAPLATVKTSWGRCGEESTFLVAALRSVCIPARQVYTPRWAHCDDNHAWVEAWVDGQWHFLGACEPEPVLDLGWFNAPASRTLLLHTRVFGKYFGPEEVIEKTANHTEINVVDNYAETAKLNIKVVDNEGKAVPDAKVDFKIYNYSEYCTVATKRTDNQGETWMTAGLGTMMVYASKDGKFGYEVLKIGSTDNIEIKLCRDGVHTVSKTIEMEDYDVFPPVEKARIPNVSAEMRAKNNRRVACEDSIRNAYIARCVAAQNEGDYDKKIMAKSWGNYQTIKDFVDYARNLGGEDEAYKILNVISDKDLRDVTLDVLVETLGRASLQRNDDYDDDFYYKYVINPRVSNEMLRTFVETQDVASLHTALEIINWIRDNILINNELNVRHIPMSPSGVLRARIADSHSRDILFVTLARKTGIPARIDPVTGKVQYFENQWVDVVFDDDFNENHYQNGTLVIDYQGNDDPRYYSNFAIKKFNGSTFDLLAYDAMDPGMDVGMLYSELMSGGGLPLDPGFYVMSSGPRLDDGSVLNRLVFFTIESGKTTNVELVMRHPLIKNDSVSRENLRVIAYLDGGSEPTTHAMQEISIMKEKFEEWGGKMTFIFKDEENFKNFKLKNFNDLPKNVVFEVNSGTIFDSISSLPLIMILNENDEVVFKKQGYAIGLGEHIMKILSHGIGVDS